MSSSVSTCSWDGCSSCSDDGPTPALVILVEMRGLLELQSPVARLFPSSYKDKGCPVVAQSRSCTVKVLVT